MRIVPDRGCIHIICRIQSFVLFQRNPLGKRRVDVLKTKTSFNAKNSHTYLKWAIWAIQTQSIDVYTSCSSSYYGPFLSASLSLLVTLTWRGQDNVTFGCFLAIHGQKHLLYCRDILTKSTQICKSMDWLRYEYMDKLCYVQYYISKSINQVLGDLQ